MTLLYVITFIVYNNLDIAFNADFLSTVIATHPLIGKYVYDDSHLEEPHQTASAPLSIARSCCCHCRVPSPGRQGEHKRGEVGCMPAWWWWGAPGNSRWDPGSLRLPPFSSLGSIKYVYG
jgi:hypothetical protein